MQKEQAIALIKGRIEDEQRKHPDLDWQEIAARKIYSALLEERMNILGRQKNVLFYPQTVPFKMLSEEMAQKNHGQSLSRLNSRGGMGGMEILANIKNNIIAIGIETQKDVDELNALIKTWETTSKQ